MNRSNDQETEKLILLDSAGASAASDAGSGTELGPMSPLIRPQRIKPPQAAGRCKYVMQPAAQTQQQRVPQETLTSPRQTLDALVSDWPFADSSPVDETPLANADKTPAASSGTKQKRYHCLSHIVKSNSTFIFLVNCRNVA